MTTSPSLSPRVANQAGTSIENGHFVLTMMPSLYCELNCPHCYLSKAERRDTTRLSDHALDGMMAKVDAYYQQRNLPAVSIHAYQYGGEPTSMGVEAFNSMLDVLDSRFRPERGYHLRHTILSALVGVDLHAWERLILERCGGYMQSSYDGRMRGGAYVREWDAQMRKANDLGFDMGTISVVNSRLLEEGPESTLAYLAELGVVEASFLPFMENLQNTGKIYDKLAPTMDAWSTFMIGLGEAWIAQRSRGHDVPEIGQMRFVLAQDQRPHGLANIAAQTLFLLPNGDYALPDYRQGWKEYMRRFGNAGAVDFASILNGTERRSYLRRQALRNANPACMGCPDGGRCVMEFWKPNREGDECFGGRRFVQWVLHNRHRIEAADRAWIGTEPHPDTQASLQAWTKSGVPLSVRQGGISATASLY